MSTPASFAFSVNCVSSSIKTSESPTSIKIFHTISKLLDQTSNINTEVNKIIKKKKIYHFDNLI